MPSPAQRSTSTLAIDRKLCLDYDLAQLNLEAAIASIHTVSEFVSREKREIEELLRSLFERGIYTAHRPGQFLFAFDRSPCGLLITLLREADRLFMVTKQGVVKDVLDKNPTVTEASFSEKLAHNAARHREEYRLYREAAMDDWRFLNGTLYRTQGGYRLFEEMSRQKLTDGGIKMQAH